MNERRPIQFLKPGEPFPEGAQHVHFGSIDSVLRPRGSMEKESLSESLFEWMVSNFQMWTDPKYADSLEPSDTCATIAHNANEEFHHALNALYVYVHAITTGDAPPPDECPRMMAYELAQSLDQPVTDRDGFTHQPNRSGR